MKKIVIFGGAGFIGSNLAKRLAFCGCKVTVVDTFCPHYGANWFNLDPIVKDIEVIKGSICDEKIVQKCLDGASVIFNLAAQPGHIQSMRDPFIDLDINAFGTLNLLECARKICPDAIHIFTSTRQIYGRTKSPNIEDQVLKPVDINGVHKITSEHYYKLYSQYYGLSATVFRLTNTYGNCMRIKDARQTFLGIWIRSVIENTEFSIFGDGQQIRDFTHVDDCIGALEYEIHNRSTGFNVFNLGGQRGYTLNQVAKIIQKVRPRANYKHVEFPGDGAKIDVGDTINDWTKIRNKREWEPTVSLEDGLRSTFDFYEKNIGKYI